MAAVTLIDAEVTTFFDGFLRQNISPPALIRQLAVMISDWLVKTDFRQGALLGSLIGATIPLALSQRLTAISNGWLLALTQLWPDDVRSAAKAQLLLSTLDGAIMRSRVARGECDGVSSADGSLLAALDGDAKWCWSWVWRLDAAALRAVLRGVVAAAGEQLTTRSARFRDELLRVLLHAGFAAHFVAAGAGAWALLMAARAASR